MNTNSVILAMSALLMIITTGCGQDSSCWREEDIGDRDVLSAVWGSVADDVIAVGERSLVLHYNGYSWDDMNEGIVSGVPFMDVWGVEGERYAVANGIWRYTDKVWVMISEIDDYMRNAIWGSSSDNIYAVGIGGGISHYNGDNWIEVDRVTDTDLQSVWGISDNNIIAAGDEGTILHHDGMAWSVMTSIAKYRIRGLWGSEAAGVYAVGLDGILYFDGVEWSKVDCDAFGTLYGVTGDADGNVYAVGEFGNVYKYDGSSWTNIGSELHGVLASVWCSSKGEVFVAGYEYTGDDPPTARGIIMRYTCNEIGN